MCTNNSLYKRSYFMGVKTNFGKSILNSSQTKVWFVRHFYGICHIKGFSFFFRNILQSQVLKVIVQSCLYHDKHFSGKWSCLPRWTSTLLWSCIIRLGKHTPLIWTMLFQLLTIMTRVRTAICRTDFGKSIVSLLRHVQKVFKILHWKKIV